MEREEPESVVTPPRNIPSPPVPVHISPGGLKSPIAAAKMENEEKPRASAWNTQKLGSRLAVDAAAAGTAGVLVAPIITMIDRGIIENASGRNTLGASIKRSLTQLILRPHNFVFSKPFALIFSLYFGTYITANTLDTTTSTIQNNKPSSTTAGPSKFVATSTSNLAISLYKDNRFTQMFGSPSQTAKPVPAATFALFTIRDCLTIFASFNLPPLVAPHLEKTMSEEVRKYVSSASAAQFLTPAAVQIFSTPLHLLGLDLSNREGARWQERATKIAKDWGKSCVARMCRIVPAFGVGGVVNMRVRKGLMEKLE